MTTWDNLMSGQSVVVATLPSFHAVLLKLVYPVCIFQAPLVVQEIAIIIIYALII